MRLKWLVVLTVVGVQLAAAALVVAATWQSVSDGVSANARESMHRLGRAARDRFQRFISPAEGASELLRQLISDGVLGWSDVDRLERFMIEPLRLNPGFDAIYYGLSDGDFLYVARDRDHGGFLVKEIRHVDGERRVTFRRRDGRNRVVETWQDPEDRYDPRLRPWFSAATEVDAQAWTAPYVFFTSRRPGVSTATAVIDVEGGRWGAVAVDIELSAFEALLSELSTGSEVAFVVDRAGGVVAVPERPERWPALFASDAMTHRAVVAGSQFDDLVGDAGRLGSRFGAIDGGGVDYWVDLQRFENVSPPWLMVVAIRAEDLFGWANMLRDRIIVVALVIAAAAVLLTLVAWRYGVERPVAHLTARLRRIADGGLDRTSALRGPPELRELDAAALEAGSRIQDRESANRKLVDTLREYEQAVQQAPVGIAILEPDGRIVFANVTYRRMVGPEDPLGELPLVFATSGGCALGMAERLTVLRAGRTVREDLTLSRGDDGDGMVLQCMLSPLTSDSGQDGRAVLVVEDISGRKRIESHLIEARNAAERSDQSKTAFLAQMSHELRTPLNAIIGFSDVMRSEIFGPIGSRRYAEYVGHIETSARHLKDLIERVLDVSRIEQGTLQVAPQDSDPVVPIQEALEMVRPSAEEAGVTLELTVDRARLPERIFADPSAIRQIVVNLISNAVKFSQRGSPVRTALSGAPDGGIEVVVADSGAGIAPEDLPHVFEPFWQGGSAWDAGRAGVGLGLSIVRTLVELHGGSVEIDSAPGAGTRVRVRLPLRAAAPPAG